MANYKALMSVSEAVMNLLRTSYHPDDFNNELEFKVFTSKDFTNNTISNGASLFPYRIYVNGSHRTPAGRIGLDGKPQQSKLPIELHFLITVWGKDASLQNTLAGWIMRTLEDHPILPASILNSTVTDVFEKNETVDIALAELSTEDLFRIWDVLGVNVYQLSIPYVARIIDIDSIQSIPVENEELIQTRTVQVANYRQ